jgi:hypothetical protein
LFLPWNRTRKHKLPIVLNSTRMFVSIIARTIERKSSTLRSWIGPLSITWSSDDPHFCASWQYLTTWYSRCQDQEE